MGAWRNGRANHVGRRSADLGRSGVDRPVRFSVSLTGLTPPGMALASLAHEAGAREGHGGPCPSRAQRSRPKARALPRGRRPPGHRREHRSAEQQRDHDPEHGHPASTGGTSGATEAWGTGVQGRGRSPSAVVPPFGPTRDLTRTAIERPRTRAIIRARREPARDRAHTAVPMPSIDRAMICGDKRRGVSV